MSSSSPAWSWRHAFSQSDLQATTKHVLHTLGMFMNELGEGCYPSVADISRYSGLDRKTVMRHIATAREEGWIVVAQHGFRGQKWKRQEYVARWPERDLVASCLPEENAENQGEGGGTVPPASASKVVALCPEGGDFAGHEAVPQSHQDKTSPVTTPNTTPILREGARGDRKENQKLIDDSFWKLAKDWPGFAGMPKEPARKAWFALSAEDRAAASIRFPHWLAMLKAQKKSHVPAPSTYFGEKLWQDVPDAVLEAPKLLEAPVFGPVWAAVRMAELLLVEPQKPRHISKFIADLIAQGGPAAEREKLNLLREYGWPKVKHWHQQATDRRGMTVGPRFAAVADLMEPVPVNGELWQVWQAEHEARGWPWIPDPGQMRVVYFPTGGPAGLEAFETAVRSFDQAEQK